ncbi:MAG: ShlB/FhaC/HecB family hemolysin secretion/activation protein [Methylococcaceae bacterium]|nr:MAG: ShlB/FhaC/HecB family hemolysin secretion/activation protein [Methylococcaceae bacterium]
MTKPLLIFLLILASPVVSAADPVIPGAGSMLQQILPVRPPEPSSSGTGLNLEQQSEGELPNSPAFPVQSLRISGNTTIDTPTLHALVADGEGQSITLPQLGELAARITHYYHSQGYPLARAFIPAQTIQSGVVRIEVMEAHYGKITLDNRSQVDEGLLQATLAPLQAEPAIGQTELDRTLLLISDIPGVIANTTLQQGAKPGTSDLLVNATAASAITGNLTVDDYGNRYTGRPRAGGTVNWINPLHHGDVLSFNALSAGSGMNYGQLSYESWVNGRGTRLGGSYSILSYELSGSKPISALNANGTAQVGSFWGKHPLLRSRDVNLYGQVEYERTQLHDRIDAGGLKTYRHLDSGTASLSGDARDVLLSGGVNTWNLSWTGGHVEFNDAEARLADAATKKSQGWFSKWNANLARLQSLTQKDGLYLAFAAQWAQGNLDSSKKMTIGGPYTVRGYDMGAVSGDSGYIGTVELRHDLGASGFGQWQAVAFADSAQITVNQTPWSAGANQATLCGAGGGINWLGPALDWMGASRLNARAYIATPVGPVPKLVGKTDAVRAWLEIGMGF